MALLCSATDDDDGSDNEESEEEDAMDRTDRIDCTECWVNLSMDDEVGRILRRFLGILRFRTTSNFDSRLECVEAILWCCWW